MNLSMVDQVTLRHLQLAGVLTPFQCPNVQGMVVGILGCSKHEGSIQFIQALLEQNPASCQFNGSNGGPETQILMGTFRNIQNIRMLRLLQQKDGLLVLLSHMPCNHIGITPHCILNALEETERRIVSALEESAQFQSRTVLAVQNPQKSGTENFYEVRWTKWRRISGNFGIHVPLYTEPE